MLTQSVPKTSYHNFGEHILPIVLCTVDLLLSEKVLPQRQVGRHAQVCAIFSGNDTLML